MNNRMKMNAAAVILVLAGVQAWIYAQNTAVFPSGMVSTSDLFVASNYASTTLVTGITSTSTTVTVASGTGFTAPGLYSIDNEVIAVCQVSGNTLTVGKSACPNVDGRGYDGSAATSHVGGRAVQGRVVAWLHNQLSAEVVAIELALGPNHVSVTQYSAFADGTGTAGTDQVTHFQAAVDHLHSIGGGSLYLPGAAGKCYTIGYPGVRVYSHIRIWSDSNACVQVKAGAKPVGGYSVFSNDADTTGLTDVHIQGITIDGNRDNITGGGYQSITLVAFYGASRSTVEDVTLINSGEDAFYTDCGGTGRDTQGTGVKLSHFFIDNAFRNGVSLICGKNIEISHGEISNTNGGSPEAGIDAEDNGITPFLGIRLEDLDIHDNNGNGIAISPSGAANPTAAQLVAIVSNVNSYHNGLATDCSPSGTAIGVCVGFGINATDFSHTQRLSIMGGSYRDNASGQMELQGWTDSAATGFIASGSQNVAVQLAGVTNFTLGPGSADGAVWDLNPDNLSSIINAGLFLVHGTNGNPSHTIGMPRLAGSAQNYCVPNFNGTLSNAMNCTTALTFPGVVTAGSGALDMISTDPSWRMTNSGGVADKKTYETRVVSTGSLTYLQTRLIKDAHSAPGDFVDLFQRWASGGLSNVAGNTTDPGTQNVVWGGTAKSAKILSSSNCAAVASAGAAACGSASAGSFTIEAGATTVTVATTAVASTSQILITNDSSSATRLGVTCNGTYGAYMNPFVNSRSNGVSFTVTVSAAPATNPACYDFQIIN